MGFGHRVYKNYDPRAKVMQKTCHEVLDSLGVKDEPLLKVAMELERIALQDDYFVEKKLYPNIDFYSASRCARWASRCRCSPLFAVARTVGWIAQWKEMIEDPEQRIGRPRQLYIGKPTRDFVAIEPLIARGVPSPRVIVRLRAHRCRRDIGPARMKHRRGAD